jgi:hypothetical protein
LFRDLAENVAGKPGEALRGVPRVAVTGPSRRPALEVILAVESGGQLGPRRGSDIGKRLIAAQQERESAVKVT